MKRSNQIIWWQEPKEPWEGIPRMRQYHRQVTNIEERMFGRTGEVRIGGKIYGVRQDLRPFNSAHWCFMDDPKDPP